jgi:hypothetical protein
LAIRLRALYQAEPRTCLETEQKIAEIIYEAEFHVLTTVTAANNNKSARHHQQL